jgi:hypothetical protein
MNDDSQRTATNPSQTVGAGGAPTGQTDTADTGSSTTPDTGTGTAGQYDDDGALANQTPGLDAEDIRRDAGPDWPADTQGDLEADTSPAGGSGAGSTEPGSSTNR